MSIVKKNEAAETDGIAPKVAWPSVVLFAVGAVLVVLNFLLQQDVLLTIGLAAIGASGVTAGVGYGAPAALQKSK
jgi:membrane protein implicated in regulation of membrane protease activity